MLTSVRLHTSHVVGAQGPDRLWAWLTEPEGALAAGLFCVGFAVASIKHGGPGHALGWMGLGRRGPDEPPALTFSSPGGGRGSLPRAALEFAGRLLDEFDAVVTALPGGLQTPAAVTALVVFALGALIAAALGLGGAAVAAGRAALAGASALLIACLAAPAAPVAGSVGAALGILAEVGGLQGLGMHLQALEAALTSAGWALVEVGPRTAGLFRGLGYVNYANEVEPLFRGLGRRLVTAGAGVGTVVADLKAALRVGDAGDARLGPRLGWRYGGLQSQFAASVEKFRDFRHRLWGLIRSERPGTRLRGLRGQPAEQAMHLRVADTASCLLDLSADTTKLGLNCRAFYKLGHLGLLADAGRLDGHPDLLSALRLHRHLAPLRDVSAGLLLVGELVGPWGDELDQISDDYFRLGHG